MINATPYRALALPMSDPDGHDVLVAIAKATFRVSSRNGLALDDDPAPIRLADVQHDAPPDDERDHSLKYPADLCVRKVGTDVVFVGHAVATAPTRVLDIALKVRDLTASLRVHGPRLYYRGVFGVTLGAAAPFERVPLVYERAYGGTSPDQSLLEEKNPVGRGVATNLADLVDTEAPQIEHPDRPYQPGAKSEPAGWGAIPMHWSPRREYAGTYDDAWQRDRMPMFPTDYDPRYANAAAPALVVPEPLRPGDAVAALGVWAKGLFKVVIPDLDLVFRAHRDSGEKEVVRPVLDTLLLEPDEDRVELVYRWPFRMGRGPSLVREIRADVGDA